MCSPHRGQNYPFKIQIRSDYSLTQNFQRFPIILRIKYKLITMSCNTLWWSGFGHNTDPFFTMPPLSLAPLLFQKQCKYCSYLRALAHAFPADSDAHSLDILLVNLLTSFRSLSLSIKISDKFSLTSCLNQWRLYQGTNGKLKNSIEHLLKWYFIDVWVF